MDVKERIRLRRNELELTQQELAEKVGVSDRLISCWELGTRKVPIDKLMLLSDVLKCSVTSFFFEE